MGWERNAGEENPSLSKRRPHFKTHKYLGKNGHIWSWVPTGPTTNNDCAGEGQQQITSGESTVGDEGMKS
jgi:hypothetical protein